MPRKTIAGLEKQLEEMNASLQWHIAAYAEVNAEAAKLRGIIDNDTTMTERDEARHDIDVLRVRLDPLEAENEGLRARNEELAGTIEVLRGGLGDIAQALGLPTDAALNRISEAAHNAKLAQIDARNGGHSMDQCVEKRRALGEALGLTNGMYGWMDLSMRAAALVGQRNGLVERCKAGEEEVRRHAADDIDVRQQIGRALDMMGGSLITWPVLIPEIHRLMHERNLFRDEFQKMRDYAEGRNIGWWMDAAKQAQGDLAEMDRKVQALTVEKAGALATANNESVRNRREREHTARLVQEKGELLATVTTLRHDLALARDEATRMEPIKEGAGWRAAEMAVIQTLNVLGIAPNWREYEKLMPMVVDLRDRMLHERDLRLSRGATNASLNQRLGDLQHRLHESEKERREAITWGNAQTDKLSDALSQLAAVARAGGPDYYYSADGLLVADRLVPSMSPEEFRDHLDTCIRDARIARDQATDTDTRALNAHYIDAFQSMRTTLFDELLPTDDGTPVRQVVVVESLSQRTCTSCGHERHEDTPCSNVRCTCCPDYPPIVH